MATTRQDPEQVVYSLRLDKPVYDRLREIAAQDRRSLASLLQLMCDERVAEHEEQAA